MVVGKMNINRASAEELERLPGIGPALAKAIVELRERRGPFQRVEDLLPVRGIGPVLIERLRPLVSFTEEAPRRPMKDETEPDVRPVIGPEVVVEEEPELLQERSVPLPEGVMEPQPPRRPMKDETEPDVRPIVGPEVVVEEEPELLQERSVPLPEDMAQANTSSPKEKSSMAGEEYPLPPPLQVVESGRLTFWKGLLLVALGGLLGALLSLLVVWAINRTLLFTSYDFGSHLNAEVVRLQNQNETFRQELDLTNQAVGDLRETVRVIPQIQSDLKVLQGRADALEGGLQNAQKRVDAVEGQVQALGRQVSAMQDELKAVSEKAKRFDAFLAGLLELLKQTAPAP
ncbi:MAG: helix-hairpin-helix domain-containing protein [Anaerolineae bacterium]